MHSQAGPATAETTPAGKTEGNFWFYDNRQKYLMFVRAVLRKHGDLWFNDESYLITRGA